MNNKKRLEKLEKIEDIATKLFVAWLVIGGMFMWGQPISVVLCWGVVCILHFLVSTVVFEKQRDYYKNEEGEYTTEDY